jgi:DNA-binding IclR family transcriptional regulator
MQELADLSQGVASLIIRDRAQMLILENCQSASYLTLQVPVGARISALSTAAGRAYLAALPADEQRQALAAFRRQEKVGAERADAILVQALADMARHGCTTSFGEWLPQINSIAVAFRPGPALPPMTLSCTGPTAVVPARHLLEAVRPRLIESTRRIEGELPPGQSLREMSESPKLRDCGSHSPRWNSA